ncbi:hypothetical protein QWY93_12575 [Echinicola jeungdonensis]|uniref:Uncharacterized protein n=1 Tax=Echinicola jeungdonensis TaxID=709343 RepID=A0ABV5JAX6_9BACT|nr:hypothetical protein [Echinicola jeungdonensis]MDN3670160.1 hypothetical protein [Echinicola jeungdonensis]
MEASTIVKALKEKGRVTLQEGGGRLVNLIMPEEFHPGKDQENAIFLLADLFQIRSVAGQYSEVALDIVEYATKPTVYTTKASPLLVNKPKSGDEVKFSLIKRGFWHQVIFGVGRPILFQEVKQAEGEVEVVKENFPLYQGNVKRLFLGPDGQVKIGG